MMENYIVYCININKNREKGIWQRPLTLRYWKKMLPRSLATIFHKTVKIEPLFVLLNDAGGSLCPQDIWFYCLKFCLPGSGRTSFSYIMVPTNIYIFFSWNIAVLGREISTTYIIFDNPFPLMILQAQCRKEPANSSVIDPVLYVLVVPSILPSVRPSRIFSMHNRNFSRKFCNIHAVLHLLEKHFRYLHGVGGGVFKDVVGFKDVSSCIYFTNQPESLSCFILILE